MNHISSLRGPKIARSMSLERRFDLLQFLQKQRSLNSHVFCLKSIPQYSERKGIRNREGNFLLARWGVKWPEYKREKEGFSWVDIETQRRHIIHQKEERRQHKTEAKIDTKKETKGREKRGRKSEKIGVHLSILLSFSAFE